MESGQFKAVDLPSIVIPFLCVLCESLFLAGVFHKARDGESRLELDDPSALSSSPFFAIFCVGPFRDLLCKANMKTCFI